MKTAEEWNNILHHTDMVAWKEIIIKIQLDAAKWGLEQAAKIAESNKGKAKSERLASGKGSGYYTEEAMLEIRSEENGENIASHNINAGILIFASNLTIDKLPK